MIQLVTFCAPNMTKAADLCIASALANGIDEARLMPSKLANEEKGCGYWRWKPEIINSAIQELDYGNILLYVDAGVKLIRDVNEIISRMDQDIWLFGNEWMHYQWCKRDIIDEILPDRTWESFGKQSQASVMAFRVNDYTRSFVKEWLDWCIFDGGRLVDDSPSRAPNHPEFRENRYDQAILTTMAYRDGIKLHGWFVRYPTFEPQRTAGYEGDNYPTLFLHHRWRNHEWQEGLIN